MQYQDQLIQAISEKFEVEEGVLRCEANIQQTLNLDSIGAMELVVLIKKTTGILIPMRTIPSIVTFDDLFSFLDSKKI